MTISYDFIVVGSGPAGCLLSSRLAKTKAKPSVLLIEAGPGSNPADVDWLTDRYMTFAQQPTLNWQYKTVPQKHLNDRIIDYSRGRGLGGSTNINFGMLYAVVTWSRRTDVAATIFTSRYRINTDAMV